SHLRGAPSGGRRCADGATPAADLRNPRIYPPEEVIAKCETLIELGDVARLYDEAWTTIQAA
ncbi:MAG: hypothetical protein ACREEV_00565, partial [Dongiaceae bacterium]